MFTCISTISAFVRDRRRLEPIDYQHGRVRNGRVALVAELGRASARSFAHVRRAGRSQHGTGRH